MDKSMTGDGAVVRLWQFNDGWLGVWAPREGDTLEPLTFDHMIEEHSALAAHSRQQAAEIERLNSAVRSRNGEVRNLSEMLANEATRGDAAEARTADLLKALEDAEAILGALNAWISLGMHKAMATGGPAQELMLKDIQACLTTIAAAKGETV